MLMDKIGIDLSYCIPDANGRITGSIAVFSIDLLNCIVEMREDDHFILIVRPMARKWFDDHFPSFCKYYIGGELLGISCRLLNRDGFHRIKSTGLLNRLIRLHNIRRMWFPWMAPNIIYDGGIDYIGTCHDLKALDANSWESCDRMFSRAVKTIAISEYVKNEIIYKFDIDSDDIAVVPNSIYLSVHDMKCESVESLEGREYIFDCNAYGVTKNTLVLIKAFERISDRISCDLVFCGGYIGERDYYDECRIYISEHKLSERVHMFLALKEEQKNWLFQNCKLFVTPSENEGFGRTPVEAALCLKPVISTRATALEETTCGLVHYYENPKDDGELADTIIHVIDNPDSMEMLTHIRDTYIERYSPQAVVNGYMNVFKELGWI